MDEFKGGTLKSGGSNKKVTNPKQAIAIAMSEAERLAGGGYIGEPSMNEYMNRPMFQTPQMRAGGGVMAGVAPINMQEGGEAASVTEEELESLGITLEEFQNLNPSTQQEYVDLINDRRLMAQIGYGVGGMGGSSLDFMTLIPRGIGQLAEEFSGSRVGRALGLSAPGEEVEDFEWTPFTSSAIEGFEENQPITKEDIVSGLTPEQVAPEPPPPPITNMPVQPVETVETVSIEEDDEPTSWGGNLIDRFKGIMQDPNKRAGLINLGIPTAGTTPKPWYARFQEGYKAEEDRGIAKLQAQADRAKTEADIQETKAKAKYYDNINTPEEKYLFDFVRSKLPGGTSDEEIISMVVANKGQDLKTITENITASLLRSPLWAATDQEKIYEYARGLATRIYNISNDPLSSSSSSASPITQEQVNEYIERTGRAS